MTRMAGGMGKRSGREHGGRDLRLVPCAALGWAASLAVQSCGPGGARAAMLAAWLPVALFVAVAAMTGLATRLRRKPSGPHAPDALAALAVACAAMLACGAAAAGAMARDGHDAAYGLLDARSSRAAFDVRVSSPPVASERRGYDCRADVRVRSLRSSGVAQPSNASARLYASGAQCQALRRGADVIVDADAEQAAYGTERLWLMADDTQAVRVDGEPGWPWNAVNAMQDAFIDACSGLSQQGRVLVPGMTVGVLGQDIVVAGHAGTREYGVDASYADSVEDACTAAGIIHLMAVSGGHFALVASCADALCRRLLAPRRVRAAAVASVQLCLAALLYPSHSVMRAVAMGVFAQGYVALGRRRQTASALCWTALGTLVACPRMAASYGYALSCAAVLGLALAARPMSRALAELMPRAVADALAMTVAATLATLPIQAMMCGQVPLWTLAANLLVTPVTAAATVCGLLSLLSAWASPAVGFAFAWCASCATAIVEAVAGFFGSTLGHALPWLDGAWGAAAMALAEACGIAIAKLCARARRLWIQPDPSLPGQRFAATPAVRTRQWWRRTLELLDGLEWKRRDRRHGRRHGHAGAMSTDAERLKPWHHE